MKSRRADTARKEIGELPVWKAFVVQFSRETRTQAGTFSGRVEHLNSGRRNRFGSKKELLATFDKMLDQLGENEA
jgi:hypothetical protein